MQDLGYQPVEDRVKKRGYGGMTTEVDLMIPTKNPGYDIGFKINKGVFELVADWYGIHDIKQNEFLSQEVTLKGRIDKRKE
ncbi:MAG: DUF1257 domain-containing protein [bacterium]